MENQKQVRLFLSCVSDEFHKPDPEGLRAFVSYRHLLASSLRQARVEVTVQEDFAQGFGDLLQLLDDEIAESTIVVHLVGDMAGASPTADELRRLHERHPDLFAREPTLGARLSDPLPISYTQWEFYFSYEHQRSALAFFATPDTPRSPCRHDEPDQLGSQDRHRQTITALGKHRDSFVTPDNLCRKVLVALIRHGVTPVSVDTVFTEEDRQAARDAMPVIVEDISQHIERPDPRVARGINSSNCDVHLHALETVARSRGISPQDLVRLLDAYEVQQHAAVEQKPEPVTLCDLALTQIALGDYEAAMQTAAEAARLAEQSHHDASPEAVEQERENVLNAYLLLAEAARAARLPDQAIAAREKGGLLIDRGNEPLFWASFHEATASLLLDQARYEEGERYIREIIAIREEFLGENHPDLARALFDSRQLLLARADYSGVERIARRVLRILEAIPKEEEPLSGLPTEGRNSFYAGALALLGIALTEQNRLDEAEPPLRQAVAILEHSILGESNPNLSAALDNLANLLVKKNLLAESEQLLERTVTIEEQVSGKDHPDVAFRLCNLGLVRYLTNRLPEAEHLLRRALVINEKNYRMPHPAVGTLLRELSWFLIVTNRLAEAGPMIARALGILEETHGSNHPAVAAALRVKANLLLETSRFAEAEPLLRRALTIDEARFGLDHPTVAGDLGLLSVLLLETNLFTEAEPLLRRALSINEKSYGPNHRDVAVALNYLARLLQRTNRLVESEPLARRALVIHENCFGPEHPRVASDLHTLAQILQRTNRLTDGEQAAQRALAISETSYGPRHPEVARDRHLLAQFLQQTGRAADAEEMMRQSVEILLWFKSVTGYEHRKYQEYAANYRLLLTELGHSPQEIEAKLNTLL